MISRHQNKVFVLRRNRGQGGVEKAAERLASQLERHFAVQRLWAGTHYQGNEIPGQRGAAWWRSWRYTRFVDALRLQRPRQLVLSLEFGPDCDIYRAGDGVHHLNVRRRYGRHKGWVFNPWNWYAPRLQRKCLASAQVVVANSKLVEQLLQQEYPHLAQKTVTIYNGFDPQIYKTTSQPKPRLRADLGLPTEGLLLLLAGHGFARKGLRHAITLLDELVNTRQRKACLVVAGQGDPRFVARQTARAALQANVHYVGSVSGITRYYQAADFMVLPTRHDPFSNACLEALACGCPVVTSDQNGAAEVLTPDNGCVTPTSFDRHELDRAADFICRFDRSPPEVAATVAHLTQDREMKAYLSLLDDLFARQRSGQLERDDR